MFSRALIHIGLAVILLGVFVSATSQQVTVANNVRQGSPFQASGLAITLTDYTTFINNNSIELTQGIFPQSSNILIHTIIKGENAYTAELSMSLYPAYGIVSEPAIIRTGSDDIYIHLNITQEIYNSLLNILSGNASKPQTFTVTVQTIPMINIIWAGVGILLIGSVASTALLSKKSKRR